MSLVSEVALLSSAQSMTRVFLWITRPKSSTISQEAYLPATFLQYGGHQVRFPATLGAMNECNGYYEPCE